MLRKDIQREINKRKRNRLRRDNESVVSMRSFSPHRYTQLGVRVSHVQLSDYSHNK